MLILPVLIILSLKVFLKSAVPVFHIQMLQKKINQTSGKACVCHVNEYVCEVIER